MCVVNGAHADLWSSIKPSFIMYCEHKLSLCSADWVTAASQWISVMIIECGQMQPTLYASSLRFFFNEVIKFLYCFDILFFEKLISSELSLDTRAALLWKVFPVSQRLTSLGKLQVCCLLENRILPCLFPHGQTKTSRCFGAHSSCRGFSLGKKRRKQNEDLEHGENAEGWSRSCACSWVRLFKP